MGPSISGRDGTIHEPSPERVLAPRHEAVSLDTVYRVTVSLCRLTNSSQAPTSMRPPYVHTEYFNLAQRRSTSESSLPTEATR